MRRMAITMLGGALALVGAAACDSDSIGENIAEEVVENAGDAGDVDIETGGDIPDCFPDDTPVPDGDVQFGFGAEDGGDALCNVTIEIDGDIGDALSEYRSALEDDGWDTGFEADSPEGELFGATKGDLGLFVTGSDAGGTSVINITAGDRAVAGSG